MKTVPILTINGGSSSIRFAVFNSGAVPTRLIEGKLERLGTPEALLQASVAGQSTPALKISSRDDSGIESLVDWLGRHTAQTPAAIGHRIVHGMGHATPEPVTPALLTELREITPYDPEHMPREIQLIESLQREYPSANQVVCFDTAFHRTMPKVATLLPIPRRYAGPNVRRYGFHGLSYTYLTQELSRVEPRADQRRRVILAHLGSGASLAAVLDGRCVDTSMGFTPTGGLVMGTRSGDLDPGLMSYLAQTHSLDNEQFRHVVNHESGLLGMSESSADVRDLLELERHDGRARDALDLFCYQAKRWIGSFAAVLGGLDTLVFAGGVGENAAPIRSRICEGLEFLGVGIDADANTRNVAVISSDTSRATVRVMRTDEECVIAQMTCDLLGLTG